MIKDKYLGTHPLYSIHNKGKMGKGVQTLKGDGMKKEPVVQFRWDC